MTAFLQLNALFVSAYPVTDVPHIPRDDTPPAVLGEHANNRTIVVVFCMTFSFLLAFAQGYRAGRMAGQKSTARVTDILVFAQGFVSTAFVFAVGINSAGLGLATDTQCYAAIRVCIAMYGVAKIALYLFLLERVHIVRAPFIDRIRDPVWVVGTILTVGGFAGIMGYEFVSPRAELSRVDGICRIGIQPGSGIAVIVLDTAINVALTFIFIWQLRPALGSLTPWRSSHEPNSASGSGKRSCLDVIRRRSDDREQSSSRNASQRNLKIMLFRNVIGSSLLLCATIANNAIFLGWTLGTHSHACQLMCLTDIVLGMLVTNWLTVRSTQAPSEASRQTASTSGMGSAITRRQTLEFGQNTESSWISPIKPVANAHVTQNP
ncbi:hypothetical protein SVAN01_11570 [Stagonosporopsis vannaccii]|nr:hypothetical protein SVAN01_11570 [Stagonosporopsis vannaccii]